MAESTILASRKPVCLERVIMDSRTHDSKLSHLPTMTPWLIQTGQQSWRLGLRLILKRYA